MSEAPKQKLKSHPEQKSIDKNLILEDESLGIVVDIDLDWPGYLKAPFDKGTFAEKFRAIKWELLNKGHKTQGARRLLVTSSCANEGKTAVVYNLGLSLSLEREWQSVMVDTSDESDSLTNKLYMGNRLGLTDYLLGEAQIKDIVYKTSQPHCSLVPIGTQVQLRSELIASQKMKEFVMEIQAFRENAYVIFDSKQMIDYADCKVIAPLVDQIVYVVHSGITPKATVDDLISTLPKEKLAGVIVNQELWAK